MAREHVFLIIVLLSSFLSSTIADSPVQHEIQDENFREKWIKLSEVDGKTIIPVKIAMKQNNLDLGPDLLYSVSDPTSERYGKHFTEEQVAKIFEPSFFALDSVRQWLGSRGISEDRISLPYSKQWMRTEMTATELGHLLNTTYYHWKDSDSGELSIACESYYVPNSVANSIDFIIPGIRPTAKSLYRRIIPRRELQLQAESNSEEVHEAKRNKKSQPTTIEDILNLYEVHDTLQKNSNNTFGLFESRSIYRQSDLNLFFTKYYPAIPNGTHPIYRKIDGAVGLDDEGLFIKYALEASADLQMSYPLIYPDPSIFFEVDDLQWEKKETDDNKINPFNDFLDALDGSYCNYSAFGITGNEPGVDPVYPDPSNRTNSYKGKLQCGIYKSPKVISFSYANSERYFPVNYQRRQCNEFLKFGLMGVTLAFSSGDDGVNTQSCFKQNSTTKHKIKAFDPNSPTGCPWTTAVGATRLPYGEAPKAGNEVAAALQGFRSGSGFSNVHPAPKYQADIVRNYLKKNPPGFSSYAVKNQNKPPTYKNGTFIGKYNRAGRAYPDVSAIGQTIPLYDVNLSTQISGTSLSTPLFAGIISRINNYRLVAGKSTLGFINPVLYKHPEIFNDVTEGNSAGCGTDGFVASEGWDPVTGLGTPNYPKMKKLFLSLP